MTERIELVNVQMTPKLSFPHKDIRFNSINISSSSIIGIEKVENIFILTLDKESVKFNLENPYFENFENLIFYTKDFEAFPKRLYASLLEKS